MKTKREFRATFDFVGIGLSLLCLVHCLAFPVLIAFAPAILRGLPGDEITHRSLAVLVALAGLFAFRSGYKVHHIRWVLAVFVTGLALVSIAAVLGDAALSARGEMVITVCGGLLLVTAHLFNHSFCRSCAVRSCSQSCTCGEEEMFSIPSAGGESL